MLTNNSTTDWPFGFGFCYCGCGQRTNTATKTSTRIHIVKGQQRKYVSGHNTTRPPIPDKDRFWAKVNKKGPEDCWEWLAAKNQLGYGMFRGSSSGFAHRVAYELAYGRFPGGFCVLHHCDNPPCVNPNHLFLGTRHDNNQDRCRKGRNGNIKGIKHPLAILNEKKVQIIRMRRKNGDKLKSIAGDFGVSLSCIYSVCEKRTWSHI